MQNSVRRLLLFAACAVSAGALAGCSVSDLGLTTEPARSLPLAEPAISSDIEDPTLAEPIVADSIPDDPAPGDPAPDDSSPGDPSLGESAPASASDDAATAIPAGGSTTRAEEDVVPVAEEVGPELRLSTDPDATYLPGTCLQSPGAGEAPTPVPCTEPHSIEVYAVRQLPGGPDASFVGLDAAIALCNEDFFRATGVGIGLATILERSVLRPGPQTWAAGERDVTCYVVYPSPIGQPLTAIDPTRGFGRVSIYGLRPGDCLVDFAPQATSFVLVACDQPHDGEVFAALVLPPGDFPGDGEIERLADELCYGQGFQDFVGTPYRDSSVTAMASRPTVDTWSLGHRTVGCVLTDDLVRAQSFAGSGL